MRSKIKSKRLATLVIIFIFAFASLLSLISFAPPATKASGAAVYNSSLRFRQVEAGEDFVIALSYNNELFGWSLKRPAARDFGSTANDTATLGDYYPGVPTKINFQYYEYGKDDNEIIDTAAGKKIAKSDDPIIKIAVTRTTAALITTNGYIYTWGYDPADEFEQGSVTSSGNMVKNQLLFRNKTDEAADTYGIAIAGRNFYIPQPIMHLGISVPDDDDWSFPSTTIGAGNISGAENNYVVTVGNYYISWGQSFYNLNRDLNRNTAEDTNSLASYNFSINKSPIAAYGKVGTEIVGGSDYYIAVGSGANDVWFKGKNFYLTSNSVSTIFNLTDYDTLGQSKPANTAYIHVGNTTNNSSADFVTVEEANANVFDNSADVTTKLAVKKSARVEETFIDNAGNTIITASSFSDYIGAGNGYINYVKTDGLLATAGDTTRAKYTNINNIGGISFLQVVAGKTPSSKTGIHNNDGAPGTYSAAIQRLGVAIGGVNAPSTYPSATTAIGTYQNPGYTIENAFIDIKSTDKYISAALDANYNVYAWSDATAASATPIKFYHTDGTREISFNAGTTKIIKLTPGYGNNLFALDNTGKIYKITESSPAGTFKGVLIDAFREPNATIPVAGTETTLIDNWTVNSTGKSVTLTGAYNPDGARSNPAGPSFTGNTNNNTFKINAGYFYDNGTTPVAVSNDVKVKGTYLTDAMLNTSGSTNFIKSSNSGDVYRIMINSSIPGVDTSGTVAPNTVFNDGSLSIAGTNTDIGTVTFWYRETTGDYIHDIPITNPATLNKYLLCRTVYDGVEDLHFEIKPLRSTMGKQIVMKFYIGRFDNASRFSDTDATFYDAKAVELAMKFDNTSASGTQHYTNSIANGNTAIPLLDPNNPSNNSYSIAVTDVSSGFDELIALFGAKSGDFSTLLMTEVASKDPGAPLSSKILSGNLEYTLGTGANGAAAYYNDSYRYLFDKDVDGNRYIKENYDIQPSKNSVKYTHVDLAINLSTLSLTPAEITALENRIKTDADIESRFFQSFNNIYGFYNLRYVSGEGRLYLSYDVARIEATVSTESIEYADVDQSAVNVSAPRFLATAANAVKFSAAYREELLTGEGGTAATLSANDIPFHAQASLRFKDGVVRVPVGDRADGQNGSAIKTLAYPGGNNRTISMRLGVDRPRTVTLSDLFHDTTRISFAYNGEVGEAAYANFKSRVDSKLIDVTLERDKVTFQPRAAAEIISFVVEVRRFANASNDMKFAGGVDQEVVKLEFHITSESTPFKIKDSNAGSYSVKIDGLSVNVKDRIDTESWDYIEIADVLISDNNVSSSAVSDRIVNPQIDGHNIKFTALKSGEVTVWYFLKRFNETIKDSFKLVVESVSILPYKLSIANFETIYLDTVKSSLRAMNSSSSFQNFDALLLADASYDEQMPKGTYYQVYRDSDGDGILEWETAKQSEITFVDSTMLSTSKDSIKVTLGNVSSAAEQVRSRIVLKFISPDGTHTFEAAIEISPANKLLMQSADDGATIKPLNINITYGEDFPGQATNAASSPVRNQNNSVTIPLTYFVNCLPSDQRYEFSGAKIGFVKPDEGYETYFSYEKAAGSSNVDVLIITPTYPTKLLETEGIMVSMSVNTQADVGTPSANYIFSFYISISGLTIDLDKDQYGQIFLITMLSVFALLLIVFFIRMTVFWRRKAQQKRIIRKNQMLIKMRDKMHNKTAAVSKEQLVRTKMKMEDPKYAKMFTTMRTDKEAETGISLDNSAIAQKAENKTKAAGKSKKKGKTSNIDQLKAELEAKKMAFAQMQGGVPPAMAMDSTMGGIEMDQSIIDSGPVFDNYQGGLSREDVESQIKAKLAEDSFLEFETIEPEENNIV